MLCRDFKPLADHATDLRRRLEGRMDPEHVLRGLQGAAQEGLLVSHHRLCGALRGLAESPHPPLPSALAVITRNRSALLSRCLESFLRNARDHGRKADFIVIDDSDSEAGQNENRALLKGLGSRYAVRISYLGRADKRKFIETAARDGVSSPRILSFALEGDPRIPFSPGANRNALLLERAGDLFLSVDDDITCEQALLPGASTEGLVLNSEMDPTEFHFFPDLDSVRRAVRPWDGDFFAAHERLLGRSVLRCAGQTPASLLDLDRVNGEFLRWVRTGGGAIVVTQTGLYGDSGMGSPSLYLLLDAPSRKRLLETETIYRMTRCTRIVARGFPQAAIGNGTHFMTYSAGFVHRGLLPPFLPVLRNEDGAFAVTLRKCFERNCVGYLPQGVFHSPPQPRSYSEDDLWMHAGRISFSNVLMALTASAPLPPHRPSAGKLVALGSLLTEAALLPAEHFWETVRTLLWQQSAQWMGMLEQRVREMGEVPNSFVEDVRQSLERVRGRMSSDQFGHPEDLAECLGASGAPAASQELVELFGQLAADWPDIVAKARQCRKEGAGMAREL
jgi:hypothetical protein